VVITVDILKKINNSIASGNYLTIGQIAKECSLDEKMLTHVCGDLSRYITSMGFLFSTIDSYLEEMHKRMRMMGDCYRAIQKMQLDNGVIKPWQNPAETPILW
jgi:hypothetical protein